MYNEVEPHLTGRKAVLFGSKMSETTESGWSCGEHEPKSRRRCVVTLRDASRLSRREASERLGSIEAWVLAGYSAHNRPECVEFAHRRFSRDTAITIHAAMNSPLSASGLTAPLPFTERTSSR